MPRPGEACSAYLVRAAGTMILLDIGNGAFSRLELAAEYVSLGAVLISHMHADHFFDIVPFRYALKYGHLPFVQRIPLWLPPGGKARLDALRMAVSHDAPADFFESVFVVREYDWREVLPIQHLRIRFQRTKHFIEAHAMRIECDGRSLTYSADTAPSDDVVEFARSSSLFLCEASLGTGTERGERGHSSALEAGRMAARAGVGRLVLTHYPFAHSIGDMVAQAKNEYDGPVDAAVSGLKITV